MWSLSFFSVKLFKHVKVNGYVPIVCCPWELQKQKTIMKKIAKSLSDLRSQIV